MVFRPVYSYNTYRPFVLGLLLTIKSPFTYWPFSFSQASHSSLNSFISHGLIAPYCCCVTQNIVREQWYKREQCHKHQEKRMTLTYASWKADDAEAFELKGRNPDPWVLAYIHFPRNCGNELELNLFVWCLDFRNDGELTCIGWKIWVVGQDAFSRCFISNLKRCHVWAIIERLVERVADSLTKDLQSRTLLGIRERMLLGMKWMQ